MERNKCPSNSVGRGRDSSGRGQGSSSSFASDAPSKLHVLGHYSHPLGVNCTQVSVFKETYHVGFSRLLQGQDSRWLEAQIIFILGGHLPHESLERKFSDKEVSTLLVFPNFPQRNGPRSESVWLLYPSSRRSCLPGRLISQVFPRGLSACLFSSSLLSPRHFVTGFEYWKFLIVRVPYRLLSYLKGRLGTI